MASRGAKKRGRGNERMVGVADKGQARKLPSPVWPLLLLLPLAPIPLLLFDALCPLLSNTFCVVADFIHTPQFDPFAAA